MTESTVCEAPCEIVEAESCELLREVVLVALCEVCCEPVIDSLGGIAILCEAEGLSARVCSSNEVALCDCVDNCEDERTSLEEELPVVLGELLEDPVC